MWYINLLQQLAKMICPADQEGAAKYIKTLIQLFKCEFNRHSDFDAGFVFGLIGALYKYYELTSRLQEEVSLQDFARISLGFALLYYKATDEETIYCNDFKYVIADRRIYSKLGLIREISKDLNDYVEGFLVYRWLTPFTETKSLKKHAENREKLKDFIYLKKLKEYEIEAFELLNFQVKIDIHLACRVLNDLINLTEDKFLILEGLEEFLEPYKNKDDVFDNFIHSVRFAKSQSEVLDVESRVSPKIQLNLKPPFFYFVHSKLRPYVEKIPSNGLSLFLQKTIRNHIAEVMKVLEGIQDNKFDCIEDLLSALSMIKITRAEDMLTPIRNEIMKVCNTMIKQTNPLALTALSLGHSS